MFLGRELKHLERDFSLQRSERGKEERRILLNRCVAEGIFAWLQGITLDFLFLCASVIEVG